MTVTDTLRSIFSDIADAIRGKNGSSDTYTPDEMAQAIEDIPSGGKFDTTNINSMRFAGKTNTDLDISSIDMSGITSLNDTFYPSSAKSISFGQQSMPLCTAASYMCNSNTRLVSCDMGDVDLPNIQDFGGAFQSCKNLKSVNLSSITTTNLRYISMMFYGCTALEAIIWSQKQTVQPIPTAPTTNIIPANAFVYVPNALYTSYCNSSNWSTIASQIKPISELPQEYKTLYNIS